MLILIAGIIATLGGVFCMKTDTFPEAAPFILAAGIILSFAGSIRVKKNDKRTSE